MQPPFGRVSSLDMSLFTLAVERALTLNRLLSIHAAFLLLCVLYDCWTGERLRYVDESDYVAIANNLATNGQFSLEGQHPTAFRAPALPVLYALPLRLGGTLLFLKILNSILLVAASFIVASFLWRHFGLLTALCFSAMNILYPVLMYTASTLYPQTLATFLLACLVVVLFQENMKKLWRGLMIGVLSALLVLTVPTFLFVVGIIVVWLVVKEKNYRSAALVSLLVFASAGVWSYRDYKAFDRVVFVATNSGLNLLRGNSEKATANSGTNVDISEYIVNVPSGNEADIDAYYRDQSIQYILTHKWRSSFLYFQKVLNHFNFRSELATTSESTLARDVVMFFSFGLLLLLLLVRIMRAHSFPLTSFERFVLLVYFVAPFIQALFFTRIRFRVPFDVLLIAVDAIFLSSIIGAGRVSQWITGDTLPRPR